jgi:hypothetical protein
MQLTAARTRQVQKAQIWNHRSGSNQMVGPTDRWPLVHAGCSPSRAYVFAVMDASHTHLAGRQPAQSAMLTIEASQMTPYVRDWTQSMAEQVLGIVTMCQYDTSAYKLCDPQVPAPLPVSSYAARACRLRQATGSGQRAPVCCQTSN